MKEEISENEENKIEENINEENKIEEKNNIVENKNEEKKEYREDKYTYEFLGEDSNYDIIFKIMMIGDSTVGKSSIINTILGKESNQKSTIGFDLVNLNIKVDEKICKLEIWDTCGQEAYKSLMTKFYKNSNLMILVYSIDSIKSFEGLHFWKEQIKDNCNENIKIILVGNKNDLEDKREVSSQKGKEYSENNNFIAFLEASINDKDSIKMIFKQSAYFLYEEFLNNDAYDIRLSLGNIPFGGGYGSDNEKKEQKPIRNKKVPEKKSCC